MHGQPAAGGGQPGARRLLAVAQGSVEPPRVIVLRYDPPTPRPGAPVLGLVGKGVTFDTGGISIKPADNMEKMKYDMGGAATMIGAMRALAFLKPSISVIAVMPATENMPGGKAQKPGDIQTAMSGKTIEVLNTDAEGRLILADGITYAKQLGVTHIVDAATLTGAIGVALGEYSAGFWHNHEEFGRAVLAASERSGERIWPMPLHQEYEDQIRSDVAQLKNTGGRLGGACTAAAFLKAFARETPWAHLDIAGVAWSKKDAPTVPKGATAFGVRLLDRFVADYYEKD